MLNPGLWVIWASVGWPTAAVRPHEAFLLSDALIEDPSTSSDLEQQAQSAVDFDSLEEMPHNCSSGMLQLGSSTYKVTEEKDIYFGDVKNCTVTSDGARLLVKGSIAFGGAVTFTGRLSVQGRAELPSASVHVWDDCTVATGAELRIENCTNVDPWLGGGGGFYVNGALHVDGALEVHQSHSAYGGGVYVEGDLHLQGKMNITGCTAGKDGGAVFVPRGNLSLQGKMHITRCSAARGGGGLYAGKHLRAEDGAFEFSHCQSNEEGGGLYVKGDVVLLKSSLRFLSLSASKGAAASVRRLDQVGGQMVIDDCSARGNAVLLVSASWTMTNSSLRTRHSSSPTSLLVAESGNFTSTSIMVSDCQETAGIFALGAAAVISNAIFTRSALPQIRAQSVQVKHINVTGTEAWISSDNVTFEQIDCDSEYAGRLDKTGLQCRTCDAGFVFRKRLGEVTLQNNSDFQDCVKCPDHAENCSGSTIKMERGVMLELENISRAFHCPNAFACPGGNFSDKEDSPMCREGYEGAGCSSCSADYARADSNVFICLKCAQDQETWQKIQHVAIFLASKAVLFVLSAATVMNAQGRNTNSAVYLNQLMSFSAVAAPALMAVRQTNTFRDNLEHELWALVTLDTIPVQASDAGGSAVSAECLLRYMGLEASMPGSHLLSSCVYLALGLVLAAASGPGVAVVVTVNCFLAKFCSAFGRYLICYRMEPNGEDYCMLRGPYLNYWQAAVLVVILMCFIVGPGAWLKLTQDERRKNEPSVLYLTRSYKEGYRRWEVERLVRKMVLKLAGATFPIMTNPIAMMVSFNLILVMSLVLHLLHRPYVKAQWNNMEAGLLLAALCIVALATLMLGNEIHWARSEPAAYGLIFTISCLIGVAGGLPTILLVHELYRQNFPDQEQQEGDETKSGEDTSE